MPYVLKQPEVRDVIVSYDTGDGPRQIAAQRLLDAICIERVVMETPLNMPVTETALAIQWSLAFRVGDIVFPVERQTTRIVGKELMSAMQAAVTGGASQYENLKASLYAALRAVGVIQDGTIV